MVVGVELRVAVGDALAEPVALGVLVAVALDELVSVIEGEGESVKVRMVVGETVELGVPALLGVGE